METISYINTSGLDLKARNLIQGSFAIVEMDLDPEINKCIVNWNLTGWTSPARLDTPLPDLAIYHKFFEIILVLDDDNYPNDYIYVESSLTILNTVKLVIDPRNCKNIRRL
jgi:hypothetical protein